MRRISDFEHQHGWLTYATNTPEVDYLSQAYLLALSVKLHCKINKFAVAVDKKTKECITPQQAKVFDYIIEIPEDKPMHNEWRSWSITPFKETFKVESDMIISTNIDHWWKAMQKYPVCMTTNVRDYKGNISCNRHYRQLFDDNHLPNVYNGFMYFRHTQESFDFFSLVRDVFENFDKYRDTILDNCRYQQPDTDVAMGIAAHMMEQPCYTNVLSYPTFTHMKEYINNWRCDDWRDAVSWSLSKDFVLLVNGHAQYYPFHYYHKDFCTPKLIKRYEKELNV